MATLYDHRRMTKTPGATAALEAIMVNTLMDRMTFKPADPRRYAEISVRAAIRSDRRTDAAQRLVMSEPERAAWESSHPLPAEVRS